MKRLFLILFFLSFTVFSFANPSFNPATGLLTIPVLDMNGKTTFKNVEFFLNGNGTWSDLKAEWASSSDTFPHSDTITRNYSLSLGDIIKLNGDGSMWIVKGMHGGMGIGYLSPETDPIVIYKGSDSLNSPDIGVKTQYWMLIDGGSVPYFIEPL